MRHNLQLGITAHDGSHDGNCARSLRQSHPRKSAVAIGHELNLITVASDVYEGRLELHQWVEALVETACVTSLQGRNELETGERTSFTVENIDDFHVMIVVLCTLTRGFRLPRC